MAVEIGSQYQQNIAQAVSFYKKGFFEEETILVEQVNGSAVPINCYACIKRIEEKHILVRKESLEGTEKLRFHKKCIDDLAK